MAFQILLPYPGGPERGPREPEVSFCWGEECISEPYRKPVGQLVSAMSDGSKETRTTTAGAGRGGARGGMRDATPRRTPLPNPGRSVCLILPVVSAPAQRLAVHALSLQG